MNRSIGARVLLVVLLLLAAGATPGQAEDAKLLRLDLEKGGAYRYGMSLDQQMKIELGAMGTQQTENSMNLEYSFNVTDVADDGTMTIESTYDRIDVVVRAMGNEITYDTSGEEPPGEDNPLSMLNDLIGKKLSFQVTSLGRVVSVDGFGDLFEEMRARFAEDPATSNVVNMVEAGFDENALKTMCQQGLVIFSEKPVGPGDTWTTDLEIANPAMGVIDAKATFDVRGPATRREKECVELGVSMKMSFGDDSPLLQQLRDSFAQQGMDATLDWTLGEVDSSGTLWVDPGTGLTVDSDTVQKMQATFTLAMGTGPEAVNFDMQMDLEQKIRVELLD
jgi:hypothetical protein